MQTISLNLKTKVSPKMTLRKLSEMQTRVSLLADQIQEQYNQGPTPERIVPLLKEQAQIIVQLQTSLKEYTPTSADREEMAKLKVSFRRLVERTDRNYRIASKIGIRLTGIGGKPYKSINSIAI